MPKNLHSAPRPSAPRDAANPAPKRPRPSKRPSTATSKKTVSRVQVLERWNTWVRVRFEASGKESWVNLAETGYAPAEAAPQSTPPARAQRQFDRQSESIRNKTKNIGPTLHQPSDSGA